MTITAATPVVHIPLTDRESEILELIAHGWSNNGIARRLHLGPRTVECHVGHIFRKLGLEGEPDTHRRVRATLAYWNGVTSPVSDQKVWRRG